MTEQDFINEIRAAVTDDPHYGSQVVLALALFYINEGKKAMGESDNFNRGFEELLANVGTTEAVLAAILAQTAVTYGSAVIRDLLEYLKNLDKKVDNEQEAVHGAN